MSDEEKVVYNKMGEEDYARFYKEIAIETQNHGGIKL